MQDIFTVVPGCSPFALGPFAVGVLIAVLIRFRKELTDIILAFKDEEYTSYHISILISFPLYAVFSAISMFLGLWRLGIYIVPLLSFFLVIDALMAYFNGEGKRRDLSVSSGILASAFQGIFGPTLSTTSLMLPFLLSERVDYKQAVSFSFILSLTYLIPSLFVPSNLTNLSSLLLGLAVALPLLSFYYHLEDSLGYELARSIVGFSVILFCFLTL